MQPVVEILLYTLKPGEGEAFQKIMHDISVPLHRHKGIEVIAYGNSLHDRDAYYLIRSFDSSEHMKTSLDIFYASDDWKNGPRQSIVERIETSLKSVFPASRDAIRNLVGAFTKPD